MSSIEEVQTESVQTEEAIFAGKSVAEIEEWVENVTAVMDSEETDEPVSAEYSVRLSELYKAIGEYKAAPEHDKDEIEEVVREKAMGLRKVLKRGTQSI